MISDRIIDKYHRAHDAHLNAAAKTRGYSTIQSAAIRAGYAGPFQAEGQAFAQWMDACNALGYQVVAEVSAGTRPRYRLKNTSCCCPFLCCRKYLFEFFHAVRC